MSYDRSDDRVNKASIVALVSAIATVESFFNQEKLKANQSLIKKDSKTPAIFSAINRFFSSPTKPKSKPPASSRRFMEDDESDLPQTVKDAMSKLENHPEKNKYIYRGGPSPELLNSDHTLSKSGEEHLLDMLENDVVYLNVNDDIHKPRAEHSLESFLLDLKSELLKLEPVMVPVPGGPSISMTDTESSDTNSSRDNEEPSEESLSYDEGNASGQDISLFSYDQIVQLPAYNMLEKAFLRVCKTEDKGGYNQHFLISSLLMELRGNHASNLIKTFDDRRNDGKAFSFIVGVVSEANRLEVKRPGL